MYLISFSSYRNGSALDALSAFLSDLIIVLTEARVVIVDMDLEDGVIIVNCLHYVVKYSK